jgi:hypothetical protein
MGTVISIFFWLSDLDKQEIGHFVIY